MNPFVYPFFSVELSNIAITYYQRGICTIKFVVTENDEEYECLDSVTPLCRNFIFRKVCSLCVLIAYVLHFVFGDSKTPAIS